MKWLFFIELLLFVNICSCCFNIGEYSIYGTMVDDQNYRIPPGSSIVIKAVRLDFKILYARTIFQSKLSPRKFDSLGREAFPRGPFHFILSDTVKNQDIKNAFMSIEDTAVFIVDSIKQHTDSKGNKVGDLYIHPKRNGKTNLIMQYKGYQYSRKKILIRSVSDTIFLYDNPRSSPLYN